MPATRPTPHLSSPSTILFTGSGDGSKPFRLTLPEKPIAASSSFAISSQLSVLVFPEHGLAPGREPARLQAGELVSFVWPRYPKPGERHASPETVKVRTTIGELGQVLDVKRVSGSLSLLPAAASAIRLWRFKPTLVNEKPVQAQQDVTIEFRPLQHAARRVNMAANSPK
jgi:TonB family protein